MVPRGKLSQATWVCCGFFIISVQFSSYSAASDETALTRTLLMAACLLGFAANAGARDRDHAWDGGWKLGHGHDHYGIYRFDGRGWRRMPGSATAVGDGWVIGTDRRGGGYGIYRWSGRGWVQ